MRGRPLLFVAAALAVVGCGAEQQQQRPPQQASYEQRLDFLTAHPYEFTCGDERHVNRFGKRTYFALADNERFDNMSRLRAATSIFFAVQEVCKGRPDGFKPVPTAVAGVRAGLYESTQGNRGNDNDHGVNSNGVGGEPAEGTVLVRAGS